MQIRPLVIALLLGFAIVLPAAAQEPFGPGREVRIGLLMTDMTEVNGAEQSFSADVFMIATWHDPELAGGSDQVRTLDYDDVWHPTLLIYNRRSVTESLPYEVMVRRTRAVPGRVRGVLADRVVGLIERRSY